MNIYVGNLSPQVTEDDLREAFGKYGQISSAKVIKDNFSGASRGFGFVEMPDNSEGEAAIKGLDGQDLKGNTLKVNEARPKSDKGRGDRGGRSNW